MRGTFAWLACQRYNSSPDRLVSLNIIVVVRAFLEVGGIGFDHTNHQEVAVHLLRTYHVDEPISEVAGQFWKFDIIFSLIGLRALL
jgi:hypothetical protein